MDIDLEIGKAALGFGHFSDMELLAALEGPITDIQRIAIKGLMRGRTQEAVEKEQERVAKEKAAEAKREQEQKEADTERRHQEQIANSRAILERQLYYSRWTVSIAVAAALAAWSGVLWKKSDPQVLKLRDEVTELRIETAALRFAVGEYHRRVDALARESPQGLLKPPEKQPPPNYSPVASPEFSNWIFDP